jgi:hypothetical protein
MSRLGKFSAPAARRIWSATQEVEKQLSDSDSSLAQRSEVALIKNTSGHTIPPFGLMQIDTTELINNRLTHKVIRPYTESHRATVFLVNGRDPVVNGAFSIAQRGPVFRVKIPTGLSVGDRLGWGSSSFDAALGCLLMYLGPDGFAEDVGRCIACSATLEGTVATTITAATEGTVTVPGQSGVHRAKTIGADIAISSSVILLPSMYGKWRALGVC